jgi:hypothetical protein
VLQLCRFVYNPITQQTEKLNNRMAFGKELNMWQYINDDLKAQTIQSDCEYELMGVVFHRGGAFGHYTSFVKDTWETSEVDDIWYEIDDTVVKQYNVDSKIHGLDALLFGGSYASDDTQRFWWDEESEDTEKTGSAYMLLYRLRTLATAEPKSPDNSTTTNVDHIQSEADKSTLQMLTGTQRTTGKPHTQVHEHIYHHATSVNTHIIIRNVVFDIQETASKNKQMQKNILFHEHETINVLAEIFEWSIDNQSGDRGIYDRVIYVDTVEAFIAYFMAVVVLHGDDTQIRLWTTLFANTDFFLVPPSQYEVENVTDESHVRNWETTHNSLLAGNDTVELPPTQYENTIEHLNCDVNVPYLHYLMKNLLSHERFEGLVSSQLDTQLRITRQHSSTPSPVSSRGVSGTPNTETDSDTPLTHQRQRQLQYRYDDYNRTMARRQYLYYKYDDYIPTPNSAIGNKNIHTFSTIIDTLSQHRHVFSPSTHFLIIDTLSHHRHASLSHHRHAISSHRHAL